MKWTARILDFPVRAAAVDDFLRDVRARGTGDLNAVLTTFNESGLCREALAFWTSRGWIVVAPNSPLTALPGPAFDRKISLRAFCGELEEAEAVNEEDEEARDHDDS